MMKSEKESFHQSTIPTSAIVSRSSLSQMGKESRVVIYAVFNTQFTVFGEITYTNLTGTSLC